MEIFFAKIIFAIFAAIAICDSYDPETEIAKRLEIFRKTCQKYDDDLTYEYSSKTIFHYSLSPGASGGSGDSGGSWTRTRKRRMMRQVSDHRATAASQLCRPTVPANSCETWYLRRHHQNKLQRFI